MSQEIHCFHELFLRGSATVVVFPRDLIQSCDAIFLTSFKKQNWCLLGLLVLRFTRSLSNACLFVDRVFQSSKVICVWLIVSNQWFVYDACLTNRNTQCLWIQNFLGQTRTFPSRDQRIYSKFMLAFLRRCEKPRWPTDALYELRKFSLRGSPDRLRHSKKKASSKTEITRA